MPILLAAAPLGTIQRRRVSFDVPGVRDRDDDFLLGDQIFETELGLFLHNLRLAVVLVFFTELGQLVLDDRPHQRFARQHRLEIFNPLQHLLVFLDEFSALELRQPLEAHVEDGICLEVRQGELPHQPGPGFIGRLRASNQRDHCIQIVERNLEAFKNMRALPPCGLIDGAAVNHFPPMLEEMMQNLFEAEDLRAIVDQRQYDHECFELGVLIEVVEDDGISLRLRSMMTRPLPGRTIRRGDR